MQLHLGGSFSPVSFKLHKCLEFYGGGGGGGDE